MRSELVGSEQPDAMAIDLDEMLAVTEALLREPEPAPRPPTRPRPAPVARPARVRSVVRARRRTTSATTAAVLVLALVGLPAIAPRVRVNVGGRIIAFHSATPTIADVLREAALVPVDGALVSAVSRRQLVPRFDRAMVTRNGRPVTAAARVSSGDQVAVRNGQSSVEAVVARDVLTPGEPLPPIEYGLWHAPRDGVTRRTIGEASGEVLGEAMVVPPVAARPASEMAVALTFDDGPHPDTTPHVLAALRAAGVKATFCVVGYAAVRYPHLVRAIVADGHTLCNHTMNHVQLLGRQPAEVMAAEIAQGADVIERAAGVRPQFFRAPGGTWASNLINEVHAQSMRALGWNVDPADFDRPGAAVITDRTLAQVRPGAVILLHDGGGDRSQTVAQLPALIERLRALGYALRVPA